MKVLGERALIWLAASLAVLLGLFVQHRLGAPSSALVVQAAGAGLGALFLALLAGRNAPPTRLVPILIGLAAVMVALIVPLLTGPEMAGARRWVMVGPLSLLPSMLVLPIAIWLGAASRESRAIDLLIVVLGAVLALQFDAAALTGLTLAWAVVTLRSAPGTRIAGWGAVMVLVLLTALTWSRPDTLVSVAWVEDVLPNAWRHGVLTGIMASVATLALLAPIIMLARRGGAGAAGLAALYVGLVGAALVGNYPLPVVGLGASLVLGWFIALTLAWAAGARQQAS